ncbi:MAG TPA: hypothetical protein VFJ85_02925 [Acidimicrobiales bacterium]|nr:hypothetical protein [Acidimicrobiales bacterium]
MSDFARHLVERHRASTVDLTVVPLDVQERSQMLQVFELGKAAGRATYAAAVDRLARQLGECAASWPDPMPAASP